MVWKAASQVTMLAMAVVVSLVLLPDGTEATETEAIIADHKAAGEFDSIPRSVFEQAGATLRIFYGHTSHGSQIITGMEMLSEEDTLYRFNADLSDLYIAEYQDDLGREGDTSWVPITHKRLRSTINVVVWSWCGGCSKNTEAGINIYLEAMNRLEQLYPHAAFVYMTGHLDGTGDGGNLRARNNQIRQYCRENGKVLFDFADIESYDPDGKYYPDETDDCNWCAEWCAAHPCPNCKRCAHSHCFNCYLKGRAFWWMLARLTGWKVAE